MANESAYFMAKNSNGRHDRNELKKQLDRLSGVSSVSVNTENHLVAVDYDSSRVSYDQIENYINHMGFEIAADASLINTR